MGGNLQKGGKVKIADDLEHQKISREDVASAIIASLENDETIGKAFDMVGGDPSIHLIEQALNNYLNYNN